MPITLTALDVDGDSLAFALITLPAHGTLIGAVPAVTYKPDTNYFGPDIFTFKVRDGQVDSPAAAVSITVNPVNDPPVADASATVTLLVSPNDTNATVVLDGSRSFDVDGDLLHYFWFLSNSTNALATGVVAVVVLPVGTNFISLVVGDGLTTVTNQITVEIITTAQVVEQLVSAVESDVSRSQPLITTLNAAIASIDRSNPTAAINQLRAFQNQVRAQVSTLDPALAQTFIDTAQEVMDTLSNGAAVSAPGANARFEKVSRQANGRVNMRFSAPLGKIHLVEASTNTVDWELVGVAEDRGDGTYDFEDGGAGRFQARFYRIVAP